MNRTSWIIIICTLIICAGIGFFFSYPQVKSAWKTYRDIKSAKNELSEITRKKDLLTNLSKNNQLTNLFNIASTYIPEEQKSGELVIELTAIAGQNNLKVEQVSLDTGTSAKKTQDDTATTDAKTTTAKDQNATSTSTNTTTDANKISELKFSMKVSGGFNDFLNFLKTTETSSRLITITAMNLSQAQGLFTAQITGKTYYKKGTSLDQSLANVNISQDTINKFQNLKTYGTPINLPTESGFGRANPFESVK